jgi:hypothetical protein
MTARSLNPWRSAAVWRMTATISSNGGRVGRVPHALVARRAPRVIAGHIGPRATPARHIERYELVDEAGNVHSLTGAIWFGGRNDEILTATHMLNIVGRGGLSDSIRLLERFRNGQLISRDFGSCVLP